MHELFTNAQEGRSGFTPRAHTRRITWVVGSSFVLLGIFLIGVSAVSWFGLQRFQTSLTAITENSLPQVMNTASSFSQLSELLVSAERLVYVETEAEQRLVYQGIQKQLEQTDAILAAQKTAPASIPQLAILKEHFERLNQLVSERQSKNRKVHELLERLDALVLELTHLQNKPLGDVDTAKRNKIQDLTLRIITLQLTTRDTVTADTVINPRQLERVLKNELTAIDSLLNRHAPDEIAPLRWVAEQTKGLLLGADGLMVVLRDLMHIRSEMKSVHSVTRGMMTNLTAVQVTQFNELINLSSTSAATTAFDLGIFARLFFGITMLALLLALAVYVYFRRAFIIRLEKLNAAVLSGIKEEWHDIDTRGSDEISAIAESVNHFAHELSVSMRMAEASSKAKSTFLANMSHEIRTPMNAIIGFTRMASETELNDIQRGYINKIENSARFLLSIINDILDFSKIEAGKLDVERVPFSLHTVVDNVAAACEAKARNKHLSFRVKMDEHLPKVMTGDPLRIFQILNNLCDNAVKFTEKGEVLLRIMIEKETDADMTVLFSIKDQGIGMTEEEIARLFQPFTQADVSTTRRFGGTGLGLTISKLLCELMGGAIGVRSVFGEGSTFFFRLPLGKSSQPLAEETPQNVANTLNLRGRRLLLVEDNLINQEIILDLLAKTEATLDVANNGEEALSALHNVGYDLIFMDIQMPVMDGITATREIRGLADSAKATTPIVAMTAHAMNDDRIMCLEAGMNDHITKPIDPSILYAVLSKWIRL